MTLRTFNLGLELGQQILVGKNKEPATITKIEFHRNSGEVTLGTTKGPRKAFTFGLTNMHSERHSDRFNTETNECPADKYR